MFDDIIQGIGAGIKGIGEGISSVIGKFVTDPTQKLQCELELQKALMTHEELLIKAQTDINLADAGSKDKFQSRWRPFIGWVCGLALAYNYLVRPLLVGFIVWEGHSFPVLDMSTMMPVLLGLLGLAAARTVEKMKDKD